MGLFISARGIQFDRCAANWCTQELISLATILVKRIAASRAKMMFVISAFFLFMNSSSEKIVILTPT